MAAGTTAAIMGAIGLGSSIFSGVRGSQASNQAGQIMSGAANEAANAVIGESERGSADIRGAAGSAADSVLQAASGNQQDIIRSGEEGRNRILDALKGLDVYENAGKSSIERILAGLGEGGEFSKLFSFTGEDFKGSPGINFRIQQGRKAIEQSQAARGLIGGNTVRAIEDYAQNVASEEYGKEFDRQRTTFQMNRENTLNPLVALAAAGQNATGQRISGNTAASQLDLGAKTNAANLLQNATTQAGQFRVGGEADAARLRQNGMLAAGGFRTDAASAAAGGRIGGTNAWLGALNSGAGSLERLLRGLGVN